MTDNFIIITNTSKACKVWILLFGFPFNNFQKSTLLTEIIYIKITPRPPGGPRTWVTFRHSNRLNWNIFRFAEFARAVYHGPSALLVIIQLKEANNEELSDIQKILRQPRVRHLLHRNHSPAQQFQGHQGHLNLHRADRPRPAQHQGKPDPRRLRNQDRSPQRQASPGGRPVRHPFPGHFRDRLSFFC